ncbi:MAG TPA: hypothetical protein VLK65_03700 [Vicinamibacteria bacterium]|nr:hypothetical protein [Vicinamibacteria bacterium]
MLGYQGLSQIEPRDEVIDGALSFGQNARAATTADAFNAVAEPRRRQILDG